MATIAPRIEALEPADVARMLSASSSGPASVRLAAIVCVVYGTGLRAARVLRRTVGAVDLTVRTLAPGRPGGEALPLDEAAAAAIASWLDCRSAAGVPGDLLFCRFDGGPLEPSYVRHALGRLRRRAGIGKPVSAEALRRAGAARLLARGGGDGDLQRFLGHRRSAATAQYRRRLEERYGPLDPRPWGRDTVALITAARQERRRAQDRVARARRLRRSGP